MFSKAELDYISGDKNPSNHYSIVLKSRIENKLKQIEEQLTFLAKDQRYKDKVANLVTKIRDQVTENSDQTNSISINALNHGVSQRVTKMGLVGLNALMQQKVDSK